MQFDRRFVDVRVDVGAALDPAKMVHKLERRRGEQAGPRSSGASSSTGGSGWPASSRRRHSRQRRRDALVSPIMSLLGRIECPQASTSSGPCSPRTTSTTRRSGASRSGLFAQPMPPAYARVWANSYFVAAVGGAPREIVKAYVANQRNP